MTHTVGTRWVIMLDTSRHNTILVKGFTMHNQEKIRKAIDQSVNAIEQRVNEMIERDVAPALAWRLAISFELEANYYKGVAEMAKLTIAEMIANAYRPDKKDMN